MSFKEYEAVGESTLYGGPKEGSIKAVLSRIAYLIRDQRATPNCPIGWSNPGEVYLSHWTGFSERTVRAAVARLASDTVIYVQEYRLPNGYRKNRYSLNMEMIEAARRPELTDEVEPQAVKTAGDSHASSTRESEPQPQALKTSGHRSSTPKPQVLKDRATGGERLKAVGVAVGCEQLDLSSSSKQQAARTTSLRSDKPKSKTNGNGHPLSGKEFEAFFGAEESAPVDETQQPVADAQHSPVHLAAQPTSVSAAPAFHYTHKYRSWRNNKGEQRISCEFCGGSRNSKGSQKPCRPDAWINKDDYNAWSLSQAATVIAAMACGIPDLHKVVLV